MLSTHSPERGAVLIHVALSLLALCAFSVFAVDWGVFWVSRNQAQNSADAGAIAGAVALTYDDMNNRTATGPAKRSAFTAATQNRVWGEAPSVNISTDVTFPSCPDGTNGCIRVDVYREQARGNPLPVFFGSLIGLASQNVRATATAQAAAANATNCLKPFMIPDKWEEHYPTNPGVYDPEDSSFDLYTTGKNPVPLATPDVYRPPTQSNMTGYRASGTPNDIGVEVILKAEKHGEGLAEPGWTYLVNLPGTNGNPKGDVTSCNPATVRIGDRLPKKSGTVQSVKHEVDELVDQDPNAQWYDPDGPGGTPGKVINSCMQNASCPAEYSLSPTLSPRIIAIALFDPRRAEDSSLEVVNILGFFIADKGDKKTVRGYLYNYPGLIVSGSGPENVEPSAFSRVVTLVR